LTINYLDFLTSEGALDENLNLKIESGTSFFTNYILNPENTVDPKTRNDVRSIEERRVRLTENNLILSSAFNYNYSSRNNLSDNNFFNIKAKVESAGNFLSLFANENNENSFSMIYLFSDILLHLFQ
jgi:hypothetical protein